METIACFKSAAEAEEVSEILSKQGLNVKTTLDTSNGLTLLKSSHTSEAPDSVPDLSSMLKDLDVVRCPECGSSEIQFPLGPEDNFLLPRLVNALVSALPSKGKCFLCRQCNCQWPSEEDASE